ncbi:hypothetical protein ABTZ57_34485 [Streptomyces sp. NPDC094048]|uniref:hypothetical protein n=1 Tax=unclassified Streptomyces TaxID=2593676 RepID=UPI00332A489D
MLLVLGHPIPADAIAEMERCERPVTVDDLVAIAYALDMTPAVLLAHIPIDMPEPEGPVGTGLPGDVDQAELRAWIEGKTALDRESRVRWWEERASRLRVRSAHHEEQLQGAYAELHELGELALQEADAPPVQRLQWRIKDGEHALNQSSIPAGTAEPAQEHVRLRGTWRPVTSAPHMTLAVLAAPDPEDHATRWWWVAQDNVHVLQDWDAVGLRGGASCSVTCDTLVPPPRPHRPPHRARRVR